MTDSAETPAPRPKRKMSEKQLANLAAGRKKLVEKLTAAESRGAEAAEVPPSRGVEAKEVGGERSRGAEGADPFVEELNGQRLVKVERRGAEARIASRGAEDDRLSQSRGAEGQDQSRGAVSLRAPVQLSIPAQEAPISSRGAEAAHGADENGSMFGPDETETRDERRGVEAVIRRGVEEVDPGSKRRTNGRGVEGVVEQDRAAADRAGAEARAALTIEEILARSDARRRQEMLERAQNRDDVVEAYTEQSAIPHSDAPPERRSQPTVGRVVMHDVPDMTTSTTPRSLEDLTRYLDGSGNFYINVVRKQPRMHGSWPCAGAQRPMYHYMRLSEFADCYGGGDYELVLFGPPRRGGRIDPQTGRVVLVSLSDVVKVTIPHDIPPNPDASVLEDEDLAEEQDDDTMQRFPVGGFQQRRGPATAAEAKIFETSLQHEERMTERQRERERELEQRLAQIPHTLAPALEAVERRSERMLDAQREDALRREAELKEERDRERQERARMEREARDRPTDINAFGDIMTRMAEVLKPTTASSDEIRRVAEIAAKDREHLIQSHAQELKRTMDMADTRMREVQDRSESRIKEAEERAERRVRDTEERAERMVKQAKEDVDKQLRDLERNYEARIKDEQRNHDRELRSKDESAANRLETTKAALDMRISAKDDEIRRLQAECDRMRTELEHVKDLPTQIEKFRGTAEALGYTNEKDAEPPEPADWKTLLGQVALNVAQNLPEMVRSAGDTVARVRGAQVGPPPTQQEVYDGMQAAAMQTEPRAMVQPLRGRDGQPFQPRRLAFATEEGPEFRGQGNPPGQTYATPQVPLLDQQPGAFPPPPPPPAAMPMGMPPPPPPPGMGMPMQPQMAPPPQAAPPPRPAPRPAPAPAAPPPNAPVHQIALSPEDISKYRPVLESAFTQGEDPKEVAAFFIQQFTKPMVAQIVTQVSAEQVLATVQQQPDGTTSPLVRRDGQKFVRELWGQLKQQSR